MKKNYYTKIFLSLGVVAIFVAYSLHQRNNSNRDVIVPAKVAPSSSKSESASSNSKREPSTNNTTSTNLKDGSYTGSVANAFYGNVQVMAIIKNGKISDVKFLQYPDDNPTSVSINSQATPFLRQEALQAQKSNVDIITGATLTSQAFTESLSAALKMAQA